MTINPSAQVYLLDTAGEVVAQAAALNSIAPRRVNLEPVRRFLAGRIAYPPARRRPARSGFAKARSRPGRSARVMLGAGTSTSY